MSMHNHHFHHHHQRRLQWKWLLMVFMVLSMVLGGTIVEAEDHPNVVVILVDDMGYSDLGCFGSEINTPHIDRLAAGGLKFTQFYNTSKCYTTRASLLTGLYHPKALNQKIL